MDIILPPPLYKVKLYLKKNSALQLEKVPLQNYGCMSVNVDFSEKAELIFGTTGATGGRVKSLSVV